MAGRNYPISVQSFSYLREGDYIYVDKTMYIRLMLEQGSRFVFLSRPRRFGKSLFLSTLHEFFAGRRNLFDGLAIADYDYDWTVHPVLHLDFTGANYNDPQSLDADLDNQFRILEQQYGLITAEKQLSVRFQNLIRQASESTGQKVVILIDEYDKPLLETVDNPILQEKFRNTLRGIYGNLKKMDCHIRFAMLTGVTKFGHLSIFSDLNNLEDISMDENFAGICGITSEELHEYFHTGIIELADRRKWTIEQAYNELRINYDGYHFSPEGSPDIYNPFSLLNALKKKNIENYWFRTGTPTFLVKLIKSKHIAIKHLDNLSLRLQDIVNVQFDYYDSLYPVLYQTGYLTIKDYNAGFDTVYLCFPNREVEEGFYYQLMKFYWNHNADLSCFNIFNFIEALSNGNIERFMELLKSAFADMNHDGFNMLKIEQHYQDVTYILMKLMGFFANVEYKTSSGRIDMVVKLPNYVYVFEFKLDKSAQEALEQINTKDYPLPFAADGRKIIKVGANFSSTSKGLDSWIAE